MTKIRFISDLHLEFAPLEIEPAGEDVLVLAGDIGIMHDGFLWARAYARRTGIPVVYVPGNHEYYSDDNHPHHQQMWTRHHLRSYGIFTDGQVTVLDGHSAEVAGVQFLGGTMWTDFKLFGDPVSAMVVARQVINDYRCIWRDQTRMIDPEFTARKHVKLLGFLVKELNTYTPLPRVIVTHHAPSRRSVPGQYKNHLSSAAYASNLDRLVESSGARLWIHGHVHNSRDYQIGKTRVVCNPRGYHEIDLNHAFDIKKIIEI